MWSETGYNRRVPLDVPQLSTDQLHGMKKSWRGDVRVRTAAVHDELEGLRVHNATSIMSAA